MTDPRYFSDEDLTAYVDGEVEPSIEMAIENALASNPDLAERLSSLQFSASDLNDAFNGLLEAAPDMPDLPAGKPVIKGKTKHRVALATTLVFGLILGVSVMIWTTHERPGWMDYVAAYQALYVNRTLADVEADPKSIEITIAALSATLGYELSNLASNSGLDFKRAQILGYQEKTLVQLAYLSPAGDPVALCVIRSDGETSSEVSTTMLEDMAAAHWEKDGFEFLLIGGTDQVLITSIAQKMAERL